MSATTIARLEEAQRLRPIGRFLRLWRQVRVAIAKWASRVSRRERLDQLSDHMLADIGFTREHRIIERSNLFYWLQ